MIRALLVGPSQCLTLFLACIITIFIIFGGAIWYVTKKGTDVFIPKADLFAHCPIGLLTVALEWIKDLDYWGNLIMIIVLIYVSTPIGKHSLQVLFLTRIFLFLYFYFLSFIHVRSNRIRLRGNWTIVRLSIRLAAGHAHVCARRQHWSGVLLYGKY